MKALVGAFNQEKALVGAFSMIVKTGCETDGSFYSTNPGAGVGPSVGKVSPRCSRLCLKKVHPKVRKHGEGPY